MSRAQLATVLLLAATLFGPPARLAFAWGGTPPLPTVPPGMSVTVTDKMSDIDADWTIISETWLTHEDPVTHQVVTNHHVIRESPPFAQPIPCPNPSALVPAITTEACEIVRQRTFEDNSSAGNITVVIKHITDKVCDGVNCVWYKPYKIEVQWARPDNRWFAVNAEVNWGCYGCSVCTGGTWEGMRTNGPWMPEWQNDTLSYNYIFVDLAMPALLPFDGLTDRASIDADAYHNWTYQGHMAANAGFGP